MNDIDANRSKKQRSFFYFNFLLEQWSSEVGLFSFPSYMAWIDKNAKSWFNRLSPKYSPAEYFSAMKMWYFLWLGQYLSSPYPDCLAHNRNKIHSSSQNDRVVMLGAPRLVLHKVFLIQFKRQNSLWNVTHALVVFLLWRKPNKPGTSAGSSDQPRVTRQ